MNKKRRGYSDNYTQTGKTGQPMTQGVPPSYRGSHLSSSVTTRYPKTPWSKDRGGVYVDKGKIEDVKDPS